MAVRGLADHDEGICCWRAGYCLRDCDVPVVANEDETGRVVSEYGHVGTDRIVLCYEHFSIDPLCDNDVCCAAWIVALSQLIRGCGVLRQL